MKKRLLSLTLATALLLANGLVGMEVDQPTQQAHDEIVARETANLWKSLQNDEYPLHTLAANTENDCTWPVEVGDETVRVPVEGMVKNLLEQRKDINELMQPDPNHELKLTPLDITEERGNHALASFLKSKGAENTTISLCGQPDDPKEKFYEQLEVPLYLARKCDYFNNHILDFAEGQNGFPQELTLGQVVFEEDLYHNTLEQLFDFLEHENIDALSNLSDTQLKRLTEAADYLLINKNGQGFLNKLDNNNKTVLDITILNNNQALADALKAFGAKETHLVNDCNNFQEVLRHLEHVPQAKEKLIFINLSNKNIQSISANDILELAEYTVISLYLAGNQLTDLPTEIGNLKNLRFISLLNNRLTDLPAEIGNLKQLTGIDLQANQLSNLPAEIESLTKLTGIYLWGNRFSPASWAIVKQLINRNRNIKVTTYPKN
ncbi:leucine-rich repeat domain-containing protein [Candidatus Babeliales bacterium]|nr:leucine-rich repeat domain-containing protein [Candidatus Babeliales bacterium]